MEIKTHPSQIVAGTAPALVVHALKENKRPIGYTAWSTADEKPKPKRARKPKGGTTDGTST